MKLYHSKGSPNSRRVRILIAEKGLDVELVPVDLGIREQASDAYKAINPRQVVPTLLLDNGIAIGEVPVIQRYLEEVSPEKPLFGTTPEERAVVGMTDRRIEAEGFASVMEAIRNTVAGLKDRAIAGPHSYAQIPDLIVRSKQRVANFYSDLEASLKTSAYVAGADFSIADITTLVTIDFATNAISMPIPETAVAVRAWYEKVAARPSSQA
ncbi:glutathione S-transferase [Rhizobium calliandrae]|uniref:Glutathione S-transferase n=1 Tax=Rhizobium calliandrae TaxID=1312182 RepID=A0ABT7KE74_9HYPH|nr:glutathione S-transferase [Rhizobium calliandrae]MDL2406918.1 glutathione S-transferase [Rhizobium calliandrae]